MIISQSSKWHFVNSDTKEAEINASGCYLYDKMVKSLINLSTTNRRLDVR